MNDKFQFEKALEDLEKIVEAMESGELTLDQALKKYEEGVGLVRACQSKLTETEKKIEILTKSLDGSLKKEAFDPDAQAPRTKKKKASGEEE
jgi:exodeoxyribonuclease VII small subunit